MAAAPSAKPITGKAKAAAAGPVADPTIRRPGWTMRNAMGQPDLSGYWSNATLTPLTRSRNITDKPRLTLAEARSLEGAFTQALEDSDKPTDPNESTQAVQKKFGNSELLKIRPDFAAAGGDVGGYNVAWIDPGTHIMEVNGEFRTSILTTENGLPPPRKDGKATSFYGGGRDSYDSYETRGIGERCIMGFGRNAGPPMLANGYYNNDYYIIQTPDAVAIQTELVHDTRIIRLSGGHRTDGVRPWMGDSVGHYEGDTLVVETTNIPQGQQFFGSWKNLKVTEWFTRVSPSRINYRFEVSDPDTWDKPWGGEYDFAPLKGIVYEYACHEGNYALPAILAGARRQEKDAAEAAAAKTAAPVPAAVAPAKGKPGAK
ncbi:hypothetical protein [Phenylobacterium sp.]|uniref:hypothetical protein n=1 Tax=Phenylobacterium sp. TaxID=1871053 RepID=UPI002DF26760|nr:hypothetical protein [Phenylobacterium sp.]